MCSYFSFLGYLVPCRAWGLPSSSQIQRLIFVMPDLWRFQAPPTLLQLAVQSLMRQETLAISTLQDLPMAFFPLPHTEAASTQEQKRLRSWLQTGPTPCLPCWVADEPQLGELPSYTKWYRQMAAMEVLGPVGRSLKRTRGMRTMISGMCGLEERGETT